MTKDSVLTIALISALALGATAVSARDGGRDGAFRANFAELDTDSNGQLTREELDAHRQARFSQADADGNGVLSAEELTARASERAQARSARMIERLDANNDGGISFEELDARQSRRDPFARVDADGNGMISGEEFAEAREKGRARWQERHGSRSNDGTTDN